MKPTIHLSLVPRNESCLFQLTLALLLASCAGDDGSSSSYAQPFFPLDADPGGASPPGPPIPGEMPPAPSNLLASLVDKSFKYDSARGTDSGRDELFSELVLCASGQGRLRRTVRSTTFFGGDGFLGSGQTVKTYFGSWTLQASSTSAEVSLLVTQVGDRADPSEVSSTLSQVVRVEAGAVFFDDRSSFGVRSDRKSAAVSDAAALCNGVPPAPSPPAPGPAPVPPPTNVCAGVDEGMSSCVACAAAACCSELQACLPGTPCSALFECVAACDSEAACIDASCASLFGAAGEVQALNQCLATACLDPCQ